eukprot:jgi/Tetstr1/445559/TSEL_033332.t1
MSAFSDSSVGWPGDGVFSIWHANSWNSRRSAPPSRVLLLPRGSPDSPDSPGPARRLSGAGARFGMADPTEWSPAGVPGQVHYQQGAMQMQPGLAAAYGQQPQYAAATAAAAPPQASYQQQQQQQQQLRSFWVGQMNEIENVSTDPAEFKNHQLPLARIKKIMKSDEDVRMISAEAPVLFAKACDMFILELTLRSWNHSEENKRRTLQRNDIAAAITKTDIFDFLVDIVPRDDKPEGEGGVRGRSQRSVPGMQYYIPPGQPSMAPPTSGIDPSLMYGSQGWVARLGHLVSPVRPVAAYMWAVPFSLSLKLVK